MKMTAEREIAAPRELVYAALLDADILKASVPGCEELTGSADTGFEAVVTQKVGPVKATFKGEVTISDRVAGKSLVLAGQGKGGAAGFASGGAHVRLSDSEGGTLLSYEVEAKVGGKLAQLGSRIIDSFAKKMADQFFERFQETVELGDEKADTSDDDEATQEKRGLLARLMGRGE